MTSRVSNTALKFDFKNKIFQTCPDVQENSMETLLSGHGRNSPAWFLQPHRSQARARLLFIFIYKLI